MFEVNIEHEILINCNNNALDILENKNWNNHVKHICI